MSTQDFESLVRSLQPALARVLLTGDVRCIDTYNRASSIGVAGAPPTWASSGKGFFFTGKGGSGAGGGVVTVEGVEQRATSGTIFITAKEFNARVVEYSARIACKRDAGGTAWDLYINNVANQFVFFDGVNSAVLSSAAIAGAKSIAIRFTPAAKSQFFVDGIYRSDGSIINNVSVDDAPVVIGNLYTYGAGSFFNSIGAFIIFNDAILGRAITDQEIAQLHDAWVGTISVFQPKRKIFLPKPLIEVIGSAPVIEIAGDGKNAANIVPDRSGNGNDLTCSGGPLTQRSCCGRVIHGAYGKGGATGPLMQSAVNANLYPDPWTVVFRTPVMRGLGETAGRVFYSDSGGAARSYMYPIGVALMGYYVTYSDGDAAWQFPITITLAQGHVVVLRHNKSNPANLPVVTVDGEAVTVTPTGAKAGTLTVATSPRLSLLNKALLSRAADMDLSDFAIVPRYVTDAEARQLYLNHALQCRELANRTDYPVSVAAVAAGGMVGPWRGLSGTLKWDDNGTQRRLLSVTAGYFASREASAQAHGAWYCRASKAVDSGTVAIPLTATTATVWGTVGNNGYTLYLTNDERVALYRYTGSVVVAQTAPGTIAFGVSYEFFITRRPRDGYWAVWIRTAGGGGAYPVWTALLTGTDNTHTTSNLLVGMVSAGDYISDYRMYADGSGLLPTDVPDLVD
jgi:hypothetical protein